MFKLYINPFTNEIDPNTILYKDDGGVVWTVPNTHRFWTETYEPWLAAGNTPLAPEDPWPAE